MSHDVMQPVHFQLIRPNGNLIWSVVGHTTWMPKAGRPEWFGAEWIACEGGLTYDQRSGWARVPDGLHSEVSPPWVWRYQVSGAEWVTIAQWPKSTGEQQR
jgi:hypothetical protein